MVRWLTLGIEISNGREPKSCLGWVFKSKLGHIAILHTKCMAWHASTFRVENSAQGLSCQQKFVHANTIASELAFMGRDLNLPLLLVKWMSCQIARWLYLSFKLLKYCYSYAVTNCLNADDHHRFVHGMSISWLPPIALGLCMVWSSAYCLAKL